MALDLESLGHVEVFGPEPADRAPRAFGLAEFLALDLPVREMMLSPIIAEKSINMVFAPRGVGKTRFAYGIAGALASATRFLKWSAARPRRVLIVDGELPAELMQARLRDALAHLPDRATAEAHIRVVPADLFERGLPDLATEAGQAALEPLIGDAELVILDNVSTLVRSGKENEAEGWARMQEWLLGQRRAGRSTLLIHHAGRNGESRGTSKREDVMDTIIRLNHPDDYLPTEGTRFNVTFTKSRSVMGEAVAPIEASIVAGGEWTWKSVSNARDDRVLALRAEGMSVREIAAETGVPKSTVDRIIGKREAAEAPASDGV